jgi:ABC-type multidrug transport system permease subunit
MPCVFFYFIGTVTKGFGAGGPRAEELAVRADASAGFLADALQRRLEEAGYGLVRPDADPAGVERFEEAELRLTIPPGFTAGVLSGEPQELLLEQENDGLGAEFDAFRVRRAAYTVLADAIAAADPSDPQGSLARVEAADLEALAEEPRALVLEVSKAGRRREIPSGFEQAVPGTMVMFTMIILLTSGATGLLVERRSGVLRRLASAPMRRGAVVLGKWGGRWALAGVQVAFAMLLGRYVFGVRWGDALPMLLLVLGAYAALLASLALLLGNFAKSEGQAIGLSVLATNVLAALGGCWWPIEITPRAMQKLSLFLPTGWTMDALHQLVSFGSPASAVLTHVLGMALLALALGAIAARTFRFH